MSTIEKRLRCLEQVSADTFVRTNDLDRDLRIALDRIHQLESMQRAGLLAYVKTHPKAADDLDRLEVVLGLWPEGNPDDKKNPKG